MKYVDPGTLSWCMKSEQVRFPVTYCIAIIKIRYLGDVLVVNPEDPLGAFFLELIVGGDLDGVALDQVNLLASIIPFQETGSDF